MNLSFIGYETIHHKPTNIIISLKLKKKTDYVAFSPWPFIYDITFSFDNHHHHHLPYINKIECPIRRSSLNYMPIVGSATAWMIYYIVRVGLLGWRVIRGRGEVPGLGESRWDGGVVGWGGGDECKKSAEGWWFDNKYLHCFLKNWASLIPKTISAKLSDVDGLFQLF